MTIDNTLTYLAVPMLMRDLLPYPGPQMRQNIIVERAMNL